MSKTVKCPKWGCDGVGIPVDTKKKFSFGKALVGNTVGGLFGPVGAVVGAATGIKGKPSIILIISSLYSIQCHLRYINYRTFVLKRQ